MKKTLPFLLLPLALLLPGCEIPGYPYYYAPPPAAAIIPPPVPAPVVVAPAPPVQVVIAPIYYAGWGWGYWWNNRFWAYRPNCGFCQGRYYTGYAWHGYRHYGPGGGGWYGNPRPGGPPPGGWNH